MAAGLKEIGDNSVVDACTVMNSTEFTIGMLVAFRNVGCADEGSASFAIDAMLTPSTDPFD